MCRVKDVTAEASSNTGSDTYDWTYGYDSNNRLNAATGVMDSSSTSNYSYTYDALGNRVDSSLGTPNAINEYANLSYDIAGNLTYDTSYGNMQDYQWNAHGQLVVAAPHGTLVSGQTREHYFYDAEGRVITEQVDQYDGSAWNYYTSVQFAYSGDKLIQVLDALNDSVTNFVWGADGNLAAVAHNSSTSSEIDIAVNNATGSLAALINAATGVVAGTYQTDAFGNHWGGTTYPSWMPGLFGGLFFDPYSKLYKSETRGYNPKLGQWMSQDPIGQAGGGNVRAYCGDDPINLIDPNGAAPLAPKQEAMISEIMPRYHDDRLAAIRGLVGEGYLPMSAYTDELAQIYAMPFQGYGFCAACHGSLDGGRVNIAAFGGSASDVGRMQAIELCIANGTARQLSYDVQLQAAAAAWHTSNFGLNFAVGLLEVISPGPAPRKIPPAVGISGYAGRFIGHAAGLFVGISEMFGGGGAVVASGAAEVPSLGLSTAGVVGGAGLFVLGGRTFLNAFKPIDYVGKEGGSDALDGSDETPEMRAKAKAAAVSDFEDFAKNEADDGFPIDPAVPERHLNPANRPNYANGRSRRYGRRQRRAMERCMTLMPPT